MLEFDVKVMIYSALNDPEGNGRANTMRLAEIVNCDLEEQAKFRSWGQMDGANRKLVMEALKILRVGNVTKAGT